MLGYSEKRYGCRGLTLDKHWDSQCLAMKHSIRKQRPLLLVLEAWGPDSSWKTQVSWWSVMCSSRSTWKNSGRLIHNSSGIPRNARLEQDPWRSCKGTATLELLPRELYQRSATLAWHGQQPSSSHPGNPSVPMRGAGLPPAAQGWEWSPGMLHEGAAMGNGQWGSWRHVLG